MENISTKASIARSKEVIAEITSFLSAASSNEEAIANQLMKYLQSLKEDITLIRDEEMNTIIQFYAIENKPRYIALTIRAYYTVLVQAKARKDQFNDWLLNDNLANQNVFEFCVENTYNDILKVLGVYITVDIASKMLNDRSNVFHAAVKSNNIVAMLFFSEIFTQLGFTDCINATTKTKVSPLHLACYSGQSKAVDTVIDLGGELNLIDSFQMTPLHYAVNSSNLRITKKLILYGADKNIKNKQSKTPYEVAVLSNQSCLMEILASKSLLQRTFKCQTEYKSLKNRRKDILLSALLSLALIVQFVCYILIKFSSGTAVYCRVSPRSCFVDFICFVIAVVFEVCTFAFVIGFTQFRHKLGKAMTLEHLEAFDSHSRPSLSELYVMNDNLCVKCRQNRYEKTIHCIACDKCVDNWDHHCFWLNCCIHHGNKCYFRVFMAMIIGTVTANLLNCVLYLIELGSRDITVLIAYVFSLSIDGYSVKICRALLIVLISFVLSAFLFVCFSIIIPFTKDALYEKQQKKLFSDITIDKHFKIESLNDTKGESTSGF